MDEDDEPRPSCNCRTTLCVRRYCPCFGSRWYCADACRCESCRNTESREAFVEERDELSRRRGGKASASSSLSKGCTCRKSGCRKNYCECFKNRAACTGRCQCEGCANTHGAKGGTVPPTLHDNGDSKGTSDRGSGTPGGSDGTSDGTVVATDDGSDSLTLTEEEMRQVLASCLEPSDIGQHVHAPSFVCSDSPANQDCLSQDVHIKPHEIIGISGQSL